MASKASNSHASYRHPEHASTLAQVLEILRKRQYQLEVTFLTDDEVDALLAAREFDSWIGRRDRALLLVAIATGLRVGELSALTCADINLGVGAHVTCHGKGRKNRTTPLIAASVLLLKDLDVDRGASQIFVFATRDGRQLSRDLISARLNVHMRIAATNCPTLAVMHVTPHVLSER